MGADAAGVPGIGLTTGGHSAADLHQAGAAWVVDSLEEIVIALG